MKAQWRWARRALVALAAALGLAASAQAEPCGGADHRHCNPGAYCQLSVGQCGARNATGVCRQIPYFCSNVVFAVCACGGETFRNACMAEAARQTVLHPGKCAPPTTSR